MPPSIPSPSLAQLQSEIDQLKRLIAGAFLCAKDVQSRYGWSRATFYRKKRQGELPPPAQYPGQLWQLSALISLERTGQLPGPAF
jgi:hypothetical protein